MQNAFNSGIKGLSLSSVPVSEGNHITVCPHTNIILNCTDTQVATLTWRDQNGQIDVFIPSDITTEERRVLKSAPYTLTLVAIDNSVGNVADFTSTLEVMVDDIDSGTTITCQTTRDQKQILIHKKSRSIAMLMVNIIVVAERKREK